MACDECEKCRLYKDKIDPCPGQAVFDPQQCPVEKQVAKVLPKGVQRYVYKR